jgi:Flp pilus assembly protein TadB
MPGDRTAALRDDARNMRDSVRRENLEEKLEGAIDERPAARSFLEPRPLLIAVGIAALLTLVVALLLSVQLAAVVLVVSFFASWVILSRRTFEKRRPTKDADAEDAEAA